MLGSWRTGTAASPLAEFNLELASYDGPFDLLVHLIENQGFDITTVSLLAVTSQYVSYVENLQRRSAYAEATSEFLGVASQLLLLKSQALLPSQADEDEDLSQAIGLADRLRVYSAYRKLAAELDEIQESEMPSFPRVAMPAGIAPDIPSNWQDVSELVFALDAMAEPPQDNGISITLPVTRFSLKQRIDSVRETVTRVGEVTFEAVASECESKIEVVYTFLAILYLVAQRGVTVRQRKAFGEITISIAVGQD
jgi:segregation and condensation protein A